ncbi:PAS domain S-box protein [Deinococcus misasensis]|uniref:PAS domain S-box protein n=1 Tax=Deinococcus misasensis TaxID=392413 RepID=UPI00068F3C30|nr:PAS domain S-box protein [Deinococcus misasensis]
MEFPPFSLWSILLDTEHHLMGWSPDCARTLGWNPAETIGKPVNVLLASPLPEGPLHGSFPLVLQDREGHTHPCVAQMQPLQPHGFLLTLTPQRDLENLQLLSLAFEQAESGILVIRPTTAEVVMVNPAMARMLKTPLEDLMGQEATRFIAPASLQHLHAHGIEARKKGEHQFLTSFMRTDGTVFTARVQLLAIPGPEGNLQSWMVHVHDVTEEEIQVDRSTRLARLALALIHTRTTEQVTTVLLQEAVQASGAYSGGLFLVGDTGDRLHLVDSLGYPANTTQQFQDFPVTADFPVGEAVLQKQAFFMGTHELIERYPKAAAARSQQTLSVAVIPLMIEDQVRGVLALSFNIQRAFDTDEQAFLLQLTRQCAQAFERVRLGLSEQRNREALEAQRARQDILSEASQHLSASLDLQVTLQTIAELARLVFQADVLVHRLTPAGDIRCLTETRLKEAEGWKPLVKEVLEQDQPFLPDGPEDLLDHQSMVMVPMVLHGQKSATLTLLKKEGQFTDEDLPFVGSFVSRVALSLEHAELYAERLQAEEAARAREQDFRSLVQNIPGVVYRCLYDAHWTMLYLLGDLHEIVGHPASALLGSGGMTFPELVHPEDVGWVENEVHRAVQNHRSFDMQYRMVHQDGSTRWVHERGKASYSPEGEVQWLDGVIFDITERRKAEQDRMELLQVVEQERTRLIDVLEQMPVAVWLAQAPDGKVLFGNRQVEKLFGQAFDLESVDQQIQDYRGLVRSGKVLEPAEWPLTRALEKGEVVLNEELEVLRPDGSQVPAWFSAAPILNQAGERVAGVVTAQDISNLKKVEQDLRTARDELEERVRSRTIELHSLSVLLQQQVEELEARTLETRILSEMSEMLQACYTIEEAQQVVAQHLQRLFEQASGSLYAFGPSRNILEEMVSWRGPTVSSPVFNPEECWGLRRGRLYARAGHSAAIACKHISEAERSTLCVLPARSRGNRGHVAPFCPQRGVHPCSGKVGTDGVRNGGSGPREHPIAGPPERTVHPRCPDRTVQPPLSGRNL